MKKVAIMQPYFFPYLGYFSLIKHTDEFILFDPVQFIRHGWIERNRILKPENGWQYISVPLEKHEMQRKKFTCPAVKKIPPPNKMQFALFCELRCCDQRYESEMIMLLSAGRS